MKYIASFVVLLYLGCSYPGQYTLIKEMPFDYETGLIISDTLDFYSLNLLGPTCPQMGPYQLCLYDKDSMATWKQSHRIERILWNRHQMGKSPGFFRGIVEITLYFPDTVITEIFEYYSGSCYKKGVLVGMFYLPKYGRKALSSVPVEIKLISNDEFLPKLLPNPYLKLFLYQ